MTVSELLPTLSDLNRGDKLRVVQYLVTELAKEEDALLPEGSHTLWSPYDAVDAADALLAALAEDKAPCH